MLLGQQAIHIKMEVDPYFTTRKEKIKDLNMKQRKQNFKVIRRKYSTYL